MLKKGNDYWVQEGDDGTGVSCSSSREGTGSATTFTSRYSIPIHLH